MSSVDKVVASTQPGLMLMPSHGAFIIGTLRNPDDSDSVKAALRELAGIDDDNRRIVVAINGALWTRWSGHEPPGAPPSDPLLARDPHFRDTGGDLFLYLKGDSTAAIDALLQRVDETLGEQLAGRTVTRAALPPDGKILDQHFTDGITSPSDPESVVDRILQSTGSCWALAQKFEVRWSAFGDMSSNEQQNVIGRTDDLVLIPDQDIRSHIKKVRVLAEDHANYELVRQALPFAPMPNSGGRERGIYFAAFAQSASIFEDLLGHMTGVAQALLPVPGTDKSVCATDKLLGVVQGIEGGYFYVPSADDLGLKTHLEESDFVPAEFWRVRSANGLMFYNSADYLNVMGTGQYGPGDPPSQRILTLLGKVFGRWQDKWYHVLDTPRMPPLSAVLDPGEEHYLTAPVQVRQGLSVKKMLGRVCTTTTYPVPRESWCWQADVFRIDPQDILAGVMPELSLGRGKEVMPYLTDAERLQGWLAALLDETSGMGHVVPKHAKVLAMGWGAILADLQSRASSATGDQATFYQSAILAVEGIQEYCRNYALLAERMGLHEIAARMRKLAVDKPDTFLEAMQSIFTYHCCLHLTGLPTSVGRLDQLLWPYFDTTTEDEAQEILDAFWVKLGEKALHNRQNATDHVTYGTTTVSYVGGAFPQGDGINQWVQQVTIGGYVANDDAQPTGAANRLTLLCLKSARRLPLNAPVLSLRVYPGIGDDIIAEAARALASGGSHPILFQEERMVRALNEFAGLPLDAARNYVCDGCYEPMIEGQCEFMFSSVTLLDPLELAMNQGARFTQAGPVYLRGSKVTFRSPEASEITSFEQLQELYLAHLRWLTVQFFNGVLVNYGSLWNYCPCPLLSVAVDGCVESGRDLTNGGAMYHLISPMFLAGSVAIDSLYAIKTLVYDQETAITTLPELVVALQNDWGYAMTEPFQSVLAGELRSEERAKRFKQIRDAALALPKWGMGNKDVDAVGEWLISNMTRMTREIMANPPEPLKDTLAGVQKNFGIKLNVQVGMGTFEAYVGDGLNSGASPSGRRNAQPFPSDFSAAPVPQDLPPIAQDPRAKGAVPGTNRPIYTAMSSWNIDAINYEVSNAAPVDLNVREDFPVEKLEEFIREYAVGNVGSNLVTITVADPDTYAVAGGQPEQYELVRVRMGGWTEFYAAMFPAHHDQHRRRPYFVVEERG